MATTVHTTGIRVAVREAKYSQGFIFGSNVANEDYARAVVERSCAAVVTLLQDMFAAAEKKAFQQASEQQTVNSQNRAFRQLADIIHSRPVVETAVVTAVVCAYAEMMNDCLAGHDHSQHDTIRDNQAEIERRIFALEKLCREKLDLAELFAIDTVRSQVTDRNRPLLFDLNAKLGLLFGCDNKRVMCGPLSPATLIGGFVVGLMCVDIDILAKKLLFRCFEQELLSKLPVLMNSVILRLEQEKLVAKRPVGFDEKNAGPISRLLQGRVLPLALVLREIDVMHKTLSAHQSEDLCRRLYELSGEDSADSLVNLLSDVFYYSRNMQTSVLRMAINKVETTWLLETRKVIAGQMNAAFAGKKMPVAVRNFLETLWPGVLFEIYMVAGDLSQSWEDAMALQQTLLETISPVRDAEQISALNQKIPGVLKTLRRLFEESGYRYEDTAIFLGELKSLHLLNVQQKLSGDDFVLWKDISGSGLVAVEEPFLSEDELLCYGQMRNMTSLLAYA